MPSQTLREACRTIIEPYLRDDHDDRVHGAYERINYATQNKAQKEPGQPKKTLITQETTRDEGVTNTHGGIFQLKRSTMIYRHKIATRATVQGTA